MLLAACVLEVISPLLELRQQVHLEMIAGMDDEEIDDFPGILPRRGRDEDVFIVPLLRCLPLQQQVVAV